MFNDDGSMKHIKEMPPEIRKCISNFDCIEKDGVIFRKIKLHDKTNPEILSTYLTRQRRRTSKKN
jgi:hypothetical protein